MSRGPGGASDGRWRWSSTLLPLAVLGLGAAMTILGGQSLLDTLHDRARVEASCAVVERRLVTGRFGARVLDREDVRVRADVGGRQETSEWLRYDGGRPEIGESVTCYVDARRPSDVAFYRASFGADVPVTLFGSLIAVCGGLLLVLVLGDARSN